MHCALFLYVPTCPHMFLHDFTCPCMLGGRPILGVFFIHVIGSRDLLSQVKNHQSSSPGRYVHLVTSSYKGDKVMVKSSAQRIMDRK